MKNPQDKTSAPNTPQSPPTQEITGNSSSSELSSREKEEKLRLSPVEASQEPKLEEEKLYVKNKDILAEETVSMYEKARRDTRRKKMLKSLLIDIAVVLLIICAGYIKFIPSSPSFSSSKTALGINLQINSSYESDRDKARRLVSEACQVFNGLSPERSNIDITPIIIFMGFNLRKAVSTDRDAVREYLSGLSSDHTLTPLHLAVLSDSSDLVEYFIKK